MDANRRFYRLIRIFAAALVLSVAVFWLFCRDPQMAMLHVIVVQYLFLPVLTLLLSFFLGRETVHPTGRGCAAGLLRRISAVPAAHPVPAGISPLRRRRAAGPVRYPCDSVPFCRRASDRCGVKKETVHLMLPPKAAPYIPDNRTCDMPRGKRPGSVGSEPQAQARNCTSRNFCKPRAQWPGGNLDRHSDFARRKFC